MDTEPLVVVAIMDALLVAMFFLFRVLPWAKPGPWRLIWLIAGLTSVLFIASELVALTTQGTALGLEHQIPLFGAIFAVTVGFILTYLGGQRVTERALTLSETDELTQLGNARAFDLHLADLVRRKQRFALLYLDVDGLKKVNDTHGHAEGDQALKDVSGVLRGAVRKADLVARLGGDEFALLLPGADPAIAQASPSTCSRASRTGTRPSAASARRSASCPTRSASRRRRRAQSRYGDVRVEDRRGLADNARPRLAALPRQGWAERP